MHRDNETEGHTITNREQKDIQTETGEEGLTLINRATYTETRKHRDIQRQANRGTHRQRQGNRGTYRKRQGNRGTYRLAQRNRGI